METQGNQRTRRSIRLPGFDYSNVGMYFVTVCAVQQRCIFGRIQGTGAILSPIGEIVEASWIDIPHHFPNVKIETFVVMPNHMHGILTIDSKLPDANCKDNCTASTELFGKPSAKSIPTIIRSFKSAATKRVRESRLPIMGSIWQRGYYERVLRDTQEYVEATNYILQNPARWVRNEENPNRTPGAEDL